jgi:hypothetical protein
MATDTQPLCPAPPELIQYEEKIKARLAAILIVGFFCLMGAWSFFPPQLPGDTLGMVVGGLISVITAIGTSYWNAKPTKGEQR